MHHFTLNSYIYIKKKKINSELLKLFDFVIKCTQLYPWKKKYWLKDPKSSLISWITLTLIVDALWGQRLYFLLTLNFVSVIFGTNSAIFLEWIFNTLNYFILNLLLESCTVAWTKLTLVSVTELVILICRIVWSWWRKSCFESKKSDASYGSLYSKF